MKFNTKSFSTWSDDLRLKWNSHSIAPNDPILLASLKQERKFQLRKLARAKPSPAPYTNKWIRPKGVNHLLINPHMEKIYKFIDGTHIFPIHFIPLSPNDFFVRPSIPDGSILNPPYSSGLLDKIIAKLIQLANTNRAIYPVLLPNWISKPWYILCKGLRFPIFLLGKLAFLRGNKAEFQGIAKFESIIILVGAYTNLPPIPIPTDSLGYPKNYDYIQAFQHIKLPINLVANLHPDPLALSNRQINILANLLKWADQQHNLDDTSDITNKFNIDISLRNNFFLQHTDLSNINPTSHIHSNTLNPAYKGYQTWQDWNINQRTIFTHKDFNTWLDKLDSTPTDKYKDTYCHICHKRGHGAKQCIFKLHTKAELGLTDTAEIALYDFIINKTKDPITPISFSWDNSKEVIQWTIQQRRIEIRFWKDFKIFAYKRGIFSIEPLLHHNEFSKSRAALGFNFACGAPTYELILDAFGAVVHLTDPPPPTLFVKNKNDIHQPFNISDKIMEDDTKEVLRGTQIILPQKYIRYILPRFTVINSDTTERTINDCRLLGPYTPIMHYKLPRPKDLQKFHHEDIILSIDAKSAYKQRKLAWASRNLIGFQTKIDNKLCYVAMTTPPFGLQNAGFIYQSILGNKIRRIAQNLPHICYVDDITVKVGTTKEPTEHVNNRINLFLTLLTATGEAINNKIQIFHHRITMMGVNFHTDTRRYTTKLNSAYKFGIKILDMIHQTHISLPTLQQIAGLTNWLLQYTKPQVLLTINHTVSKLLKGLDMQNYKHRLIAKKRTFPMSKQFSKVILELLLHIFYPYAQVTIPTYDNITDTICIVTDSNLIFGGGFLFWKHKYIHFEQPAIKQKLQAQFQTHMLPTNYLKTYALENIVSSYTAELLGLHNFLLHCLPYLQKHKNQFQHIRIYMDNQGLIHTLSQLTPKTHFACHIHQEIISILNDLDISFSFNWLRRSHHFIEKADKLGRYYDKPIQLKKKLKKKLMNFYKTRFYVPKHLHTLTKCSIFLPEKLLSDSNSGTPYILLHPALSPPHIEFFLHMFSNTNKPILVGFPLRRRHFLSTYMDHTNIFKIDHITSQSFIGPNIPSTRKYNYPYIIGFPKSVPFI